MCLSQYIQKYKWTCLFSPLPLQEMSKDKSDSLEQFKLQKDLLAEFFFP